MIIVIEYSKWRGSSEEHSYSSITFSLIALWSTNILHSIHLLTVMVPSFFTSGLKESRDSRARDAKTVVPKGTTYATCTPVYCTWDGCITLRPWSFRLTAQVQSRPFISYRSFYRNQKIIINQHSIEFGVIRLWGRVRRDRACLGFTWKTILGLFILVMNDDLMLHVRAICFSSFDGNTSCSLGSAHRAPFLSFGIENLGPLYASTKELAQFYIALRKKFK